MADDPAGGADFPLARLARLPPGRHGLPREFVEANHRDRLIAACIQVVLERGYVDTTVAHIVKAAAVSRRTFYEHFDSKEDCFLLAHRLVLEHLQGLMAEAMKEEAEWGLQLRAAIAAMLGFLASEPRLARFVMVEPLLAGPPVTVVHRQAMALFVPVLRAGRDLSGVGGNLPEDTEEAVVAGIASLIARRIVAGEAEQLEELLPDLTVAALSPYLGAAKAERLAQRGNE